MKHVVKDSAKFAPLLALYILVILVAGSSGLQDDEGYYVKFATRLSAGYYSPLDDIDLWFGPGYPLVLLPFVLLDVPWLAAKLLNSLLLFSAVILFFFTLRIYMQERAALFFSYLLGTFLPLLRHIHLLYTETLAILVICCFLFFFCRLHQTGRISWLNLSIASVSMAYLAMTKVFFGFVILASLVFFIGLYAWFKGESLKKTSLVFGFALVLCVPYLMYTYSLTGKIFYWGNSGGMQLYWMSSPYRSDLGDWQSIERVHENPGLSENHEDYFDFLATLPSIERDEALLKRGIQNIIDHPVKYLSNWIANIGRLVFNYPYSYTDQKLSTYFYIIPNSFLVVFSFLSIYPTLVGRKFVPHEIFAILLIAGVSFGGASLLSSTARQLVPLVPLIALWVAFTFVRLVNIDLVRDVVRP